MAPVKAGIHRRFVEDLDVLARWNDGLFYLGTILNVDESKERCYIRFEDDSEYWTMFKDIQQGPSKGEITCSLCQGGKSVAPNEIVLCDSCGLGYHQLCHAPCVGRSLLAPRVAWRCRLCVFAASAKRGGATKKGPNAQAFQAMKQSLPYDPDVLTWDAHHKTNEQQVYCYCGGPGDWYMKMLQCCRCKQWFHEACLQCLHKPLAYGDRFYVFVCSFCNSGPEYLTRLQLKWQDVAQLALFNLTVMSHKKYHHIDEKVVDYVNTHWEMLQLGKLDSVDKADRPRKLLKTLQVNVQRFQNARENKKCGLLWGLRVRVPPPCPRVVVPPVGVVTDSVFYGIEANNPRRSRPSRSPQKDKKRKATDNCDEVKLRKSKKARTLSKTGCDDCGEDQHTGSSSELTTDLTSSDVTTTPVSGVQDPDKPATLDTIIPRLASYGGVNHPFKTVLECNEETQHAQIKAQLLSSYHNGTDNGGSLDDSDSHTETTESDSQSVSLSEDHAHSAVMGLRSSSGLSSSMVSSAAINVPTAADAKPLKKKRGRKSKAELLAMAEAEAQAKVLAKENDRVGRKKRLSAELKMPIKTPHHAKNVIAKSTLDGMHQREVPLNTLRSSVSCYFGAVDRLKNGERFEVVARRVTPDGKVQYLIEWEGFL